MKCETCGVENDTVDEVTFVANDGLVVMWLCEECLEEFVDRLSLMVATPGGHA